MGVSYCRVSTTEQNVERQIAEIKKRYERIEKLKKLGIETTTLDMNRLEDGEFEEDVDKLKASILIMEDKEAPKELEEKILARNKEKNKHNKSEN